MTIVKTGIVVNPIIVAFNDNANGTAIPNDIVVHCHAAGLIVAAEDAGRVEALLGHYAERFATDFLAVAPPLDKAPE